MCVWIAHLMLVCEYEKFTAFGDFVLLFCSSFDFGPHSAVMHIEVLHNSFSELFSSVSLDWISFCRLTCIVHTSFIHSRS